MYWLKRYLKEDQEFPSTTGVETIELPEKGLLSGIELKVFGVGGTDTAKPDVWLHDALTKIELISGGKEPLKSLSGEQLLAHMLYQHIPIFSHDVKNIHPGMCEEFFYINMGLKYHDTAYLLDLGKLSDPKLQITYDFTQTSINGWTNGQAFGTTPKPKYNLLCHVPEDVPGAPKGFIKTTEADRFTSGGSKKENLNVPRGPVYSNLYLQSLYASEGLGLNLDALEINFGAGKMIPYRVGFTELLAQIVRMYGLLELMQWVVLTGGQAYPFPLECGHVNGLVGNAEDAQFCFSNLWADLGIPYFMTTSSGAVDTGAHGTHMELRGALPFSVAAIPFIDPSDERTWIKSADWGNLWLRIEETSGAGSNAVLKLLTDEVVSAY